MKKPPQSFKLNEPLKSKNDAVKDEAEVLYDGNLVYHNISVLIVWNSSHTSSLTGTERSKCPLEHI